MWTAPWLAPLLRGMPNFAEQTFRFEAGSLCDLFAANRDAATQIGQDGLPAVGRHRAADAPFAALDAEHFAQRPA
jgi:hypothetical protein